MEIFVKMDEKEFDRYKNQKRELYQYSPGELTAALLRSIENSNGSIEDKIETNAASFRTRKVTNASISQENFRIILKVEKYE